MRKANIITIRRNAEQDSITIHSDLGNQVIDMTPLSGKPRYEALERTADYICQRLNIVERNRRRA